MLSQAKHSSRCPFKNLRLLLSSICLRRTKVVAGMSDAVVQTRVLSLSPAERRDYEGLLDRLRTHVDMDVSGLTTGGGSTRVLQGILERRLFCSNGLMGRDASKMPFGADEVLSCLQQQTGRASDCAVGSSRKRACPRCAEGDTGSSIQEILQSMREIGARDAGASGADCLSRGPRYPSKLCEFVEDIQAQVAVKSIVFSFWKTTLDLAGQLHAVGALGSI